MKNFYLEFLALFAKSILFICFSFASFLLLSNFFHYREINRSYLLNVDENKNYIDYKKDLETINLKMNNVTSTENNDSNISKVIYSNYDLCLKKLNSGYIQKLSKNRISAKDIYFLNDEIINEYSNICLISFIYNIEIVIKDTNHFGSFSNVKTLVNERKNTVNSTADYFVKSKLANSSYSFTLNGSSFESNNIINDFDITMNNYKLIVNSLNDIADWYVMEFGGNR